MPNFSVTANLKILLPYLAENAKLPNQNFHFQLPFKNAKFDLFGICQWATLVHDSDAVDM